MVVFQVNVVSLAKIAKAVGLMPGITSPHSRAGAKLREAEAAFETLVFVRDKPVIEIDAMRDKYPAAHELHEAVSYLRKHRRSLHHVRIDSRQPGDVGGYRALGIDERMPLANDFVITDFYSADLRNTVAVRPAAGCLDIDDNVILLRVEPEVDASNFGSNSCVIKLAQTLQLVTTDDIPFRFYLDERDGLAVVRHQIRKAIAHRLVVLAHEAEHRDHAGRARM